MRSENNKDFLPFFFRWNQRILRRAGETPGERIPGALFYCHDVAFFPVVITQQKKFILYAWCYRRIVAIVSKKIHVT